MSPPVAPGDGRWRGIARAAGIAGVAIGSAVLLGWALDVTVLKSLVPGLVAMKVNTALGFVLAGAALWLSAGDPAGAGRGSRIARVLGVAVAVIGAVTLVEYASGHGLGVDQLLFHERPGAVATLAPGRMAPASAVCFLLVGIALALDRRRPGRDRLVDVLALAAAVPALVSGLALLYGASASHASGLGRGVHMAVHTVAGFLALAVGILCLQPDRGVIGLVRREDSGGIVARRLLPAAVLVPAVIGLVKVGGDRAGIWEPRFGVVLVAVTHMLLYSALIVWAVVSLSRADRGRATAEAALRASEQRFRALFERSSAAKLLLDPASGAVVDASAAAVDFYGYPAARLRTMSMRDIEVPPAEAGPASGFSRHRLASGEIRDVEVHSGAIDGAGRTLLEAIVHDVTEQRRAVEEVRESHAFNEALLEAIPFGIDIVDRHGHVLFMNEAMTAATDGSPLGRYCWDVYKDDRSQCQDCPLLGEPISIGDTATIESSGVLGGRTFEISHTGMLYRGKPALLEVFNDVTARKDLEAHTRLSQKMEAVGRLAGGVAHDFNNLLAVVNGYAELALRGAGTNGNGRHELEQILSAGQRGRELTQRLLAFGSRQMVQARVLDLNDVVADTGTLLRRLLGEDIEMVLSLAPDLGRVRADPGEIGQVLMNLAVNARDAMAGGGTLTIETADVDLDEATARSLDEFVPGPQVMLAVTDTGPGMDAATKARIFEPFFTTKPGHENAGLGLATVYGIVKQLGATITVHSEPGAGASFRLYFPRVEEPVAAATARPAPVAERGSEHVLVVEDEDRVRELIVEVLERHGYLVTAAGNPIEALALGGNYDVLLTDVVMPKMNGRTLADRLLAEQPGLRVIFMSGYMDSAVVERVGLGGDVDFLQKPIPLGELVETVRRVIDR